MSNIDQLRNLRWTKPEIDELVDILADMARDLSEEQQVRIANIVAGRIEQDPGKCAFATAHGERNV